MASKGVQSAYDNLKKEILSGKYRVGHYLPTVRKISLAYDIALGTAHKAMKMLVDEGTVVAEDRHGYKIVKDLFDHFDGKPVAYAITPMSKSTFDRVQLRYYKEALDVVAGRRGISILGLEVSDPTKAIQSIKNSEASGLISDVLSTPAIRNTNFFEKVCELELPVVLMDSYAENYSELDSVHQDNFMGGKIAVEYGLEHQFEEFIWFGRTDYSLHGMERFGGAYTRLYSAGYSLQEKNIISMRDMDAEELSAGRKRLFDLLSNVTKKTLIIALWKHAGLNVVDVIKSLPKEKQKLVNCVGWVVSEMYNENYITSFGNMPIPTVTWSAYEMAENVIDKIILRRRNFQLPVTRSAVKTRLVLPN